MESGAPRAFSTRLITALSALTPDYISVTYGAGGGTSRNTVRIASEIERDLGTTALPHLTCVSSTKEDVAQLLTRMEENGINNVLALRGDRPQMLPGDAAPRYDYDYEYAYQLVQDIKARGKFCIGAACYPEGHVECGRTVTAVTTAAIVADDDDVRSANPWILIKKSR